MLGIGALGQLALAEFPPPAGGRGAGAFGIALGPGRRRRREIEVRRDPWQQGFTRRNWDELQQLLAAERHAADRADEVRSPAAKQALEAALDVTADAIEKVEQYDQETRRVAQLTRLLEAVASAKHVRKIAAHANRAKAEAKRIIEELEDEDDAIVLLLS